MDEILMFFPDYGKQNWKSFKTACFYNPTQIYWKYLKFLFQQVREHVYKTLWLSIIYDPMSPPSLWKHQFFFGKYENVKISINGQFLVGILSSLISFW